VDSNNHKVRSRSVKAWSFRKYKGEVELREIVEPIVGDFDLLIRVKAVGLNHVDEMLRAGSFTALLPIKLPYVLGSEATGEVVGIGKSVTGFVVGDEVITKPNVVRSGTLAEFVAVPMHEAALKPKTATSTEAGSISLVALTAWQALVSLGDVKAGQRVLIHGGSGGVGSVAVQLAKHLGAFVAATASASNFEYVKSLGADLVIDYKSEDFSTTLSGYDLVLDHLGGANLINSLTVLKPGGIAIGIAGPPDPDFAALLKRGPVVEFIVDRLSSKVRKAAQRLGVRYRFLFVEPSGEQLTQISNLVDSGVITIKVARTFRFDEVPLALRVLSASRSQPGKIVIDCEPE
jgi:NADPH:quinone reductase-like Zn-dependent oxidoreductase